MWRLVDLNRDHIIDLTPGRHKLGRAPENDLVLDDPGLSRQHAELVAMTSGVMVEDTGSTNGTYLNGRRIDEAIAANGDQIDFGRHAKYRLEFQAQQKAQAGKEFGILHNDRGISFPVFEGISIVGRGEGVDICIDEKGISRRHARIYCRSGEAILEDLGSTNGCFVNDTRVVKQVLCTGDRIRFGKYPLHWRNFETETLQNIGKEAKSNRTPKRAEELSNRWFRHIAVIVGVVLFALFSYNNPDALNRAFSPKLLETAPQGKGGIVDSRVRDKPYRQVVRLSETNDRLHKHSPSHAEKQRRHLLSKVSRLTRDAAFTGRLEGLVQLTANGADSIRIINGVLGSGERLLAQMDSQSLGGQALQYASMENLPGTLKNLSAGISDLNVQFEEMSAVSRELLDRFNRYKLSKKESDLKRMGPSAQKAASLAGKLTAAVRDYRETLQRGVAMFENAAVVFDKLSFMTSIGEGLRSWSTPAATAAGYLQKVENQVDRDQENFKLLAQAAEAV